MPIYEYTCKACDKRFEQLVRSMSDDNRIKCPECGSTKTARALSLFAVGAQSGKSASTASAAPGMCGRCGGPPGSCSM